jgi:hypothetical protein
MKGTEMMSLEREQFNSEVMALAIKINESATLITDREGLSERHYTAALGVLVAMCIVQCKRDEVSYQTVLEMTVRYIESRVQSMVAFEERHRANG